MAAETHADLAVLESIAARLNGAGDDLDGAGAEAPGAPDAGEFTPVLTAIVAHLTDSAGTVVVGLKEAALRVTEARTQYQAQDAATATDLSKLF